MAILSTLLYIFHSYFFVGYPWSYNKKWMWICYVFKIKYGVFNHSFVAIPCIGKIHGWKITFLEVLWPQYLLCTFSYSFIITFVSIFFPTIFREINMTMKNMLVQTDLFEEITRTEDHSSWFSSKFPINGINFWMIDWYFWGFNHQILSRLNQLYRKIKQ